MEKINKVKSIKEYDIIRVIAVILVVIGHCTYYKISSNYGGINYILDTKSMSDIGKLIFKSLNLLTTVLYSFHMPLFFALSGALFKNSLNNNKYKNFRELIVKKSQRLLVPFLIVAIIYSVPIKYISGYYNGSQNVIKNIFIGQILLQGNTHLWFLPTLFCIFCISYIYKYILRNELEKLNKLIIFLILISLNILSASIKIVLVKNVLFYLIYFYIGYCFEDIREEINNKINNLKKIVYLYLVLGIGILLVSLKIFDFSICIKMCLKIILALLEISITYIICYKLSKIDKIVENNRIKTINKFSFGIYLYSDPLNYYILLIVGNYFTQYMNTTLGIITLFLARLLITFYVSVVITYILKKLKVKYIC